MNSRSTKNFFSWNYSVSLRVTIAASRVLIVTCKNMRIKTKFKWRHWSPVFSTVFGFRQKNHRNASNGHGKKTDFTGSRLFSAAARLTSRILACTSQHGFVTRWDRRRKSIANMAAAAAAASAATHTVVHMSVGISNRRKILVLTCTCVQGRRRSVRTNSSKGFLKK